MTVFILQFGLILVLGILLQGKIISSKLFLFLLFTYMALIVGFRSISVGEDTAHFVDVFHRALDISWTKTLTSGTDVTYNTVFGVDLKIEVGFFILCKFIGSFTDNGQWLLFVVAITSCFLYAKFIYDNKLPIFLASYFFMCESFYMQLFNPMRQMLAISIGLQSISKFRNGNYAVGVLIVLFSCLFHKSVFLMLFIGVFYFLSKKEISYVKAVLVISFWTVISISAIAEIIIYLVPRYKNYFSINYFASSNGIGTYLLWFIEILICILLYRKDRTTDVDVLVSCLIIYLSFEIIALQLVMFSRVALVYRFSVFALLSIFPLYVSKRNKNIVVFSLMILTSILYFKYASSPTRQYEFFWNNLSDLIN